MPRAEEKVCQRQMRKKKNVVEIDRKAGAGVVRTQREGGEACDPGRAAGVLDESCPFRGKGAGEHCQPGNGVQGGPACWGSALCSSWNECPALLCSQQPAAPPRAPVPARAGAGAGGIIGWLQPSPCPLMCGEWSHPRGTARW